MQKIGISWFSRNKQHPAGISAEGVYFNFAADV